jgi:hypothetical protein
MALSGAEARSLLASGKRIAKSAAYRAMRVAERGSAVASKHFSVAGSRTRVEQPRDDDAPAAYRLAHHEVAANAIRNCAKIARLTLLPYRVHGLLGLGSIMRIHREIASENAGAILGVARHFDAWFRV